MIDSQRTLELLQEVVSEHGDGHTSMNMYKDPNTEAPVCIVGHVLDKLGILDTVKIPDNIIDTYVNNQNYKAVEFLARDGLLPGFTDKAVKVLQAAQNEQDGGGTWGEALVAAKEYANV